VKYPYTGVVVATNLTESAPLIETRELTKRYGKQVLALDTLTLTVRNGITGLVGANGAGKSTLIKILLGLLPPTSGEASLLGFDVRTQGTELRQYVGYMPEHDCLPPDISATDFVSHMAQINGIPRAAARERTADVLRHVGLFEERYRAIGGYSTGMKQRVKLAQALVHDPRLLMLDEPTNGLDPAGRDEMLDLISRVGSDFGISILMSSHLLGEIERVCDNLVVIDAGRLLRSDTISSFTSETQVLAIEVDSRQEELVARLQSQGLQVTEEGRLLLVDLNGRKPYVQVRDSVVELGIGLLRMEQRRHSLEDLFKEGPAANV
jgi:ABC-2 type transport system ATP-binding protein